MISPINRVSYQTPKPQEVNATDQKTEVEKAEAAKMTSGSQQNTAPIRENKEFSAEEVKQKPASESAEALRTLASRESAAPPPAPEKNIVNADAVIAAYKK